MKKIAIHVSEVTKTFKLPHEKQTSVKGLFVNLFRGKRTYERQRVLHDVSLEIKEGEFFGIIGRNGNGKSTLLKLLAGIYAPDKGAIRINGRLTPFIELGVGFNPELTGRENIYLNGALLGFSRKEMDDMYDDIVGFAELQDFMDQKLKNYSSGMQVRLAFSIAIRAKSEILLIDEVLAVGDVNFQRKCLDIFEQLKREGRTIVFVSHAMDSVREFCDRVAVIEGGKVLFVGDTEKGIDIYNKLNYDKENARLEVENKTQEHTVERFGNGKARITSYKLFDANGTETIKLAAGEKFAVELDIAFEDDIKHPAVGIMFRKHPHENLFGINNFYMDENFGVQKTGESLVVRAEGKLPLAPGVYFVSFSVSDVRSASNYSELDNLNNVLKINVQGKQHWGMIAADIKMEAKKK